jgi:hypothetical protein
VDLRCTLSDHRWVLYITMLLLRGDLFGECLGDTIRIPQNCCNRYAVPLSPRISPYLPGTDEKPIVLIFRIR